MLIYLLVFYSTFLPNTIYNGADVSVVFEKLCNGRYSWILLALVRYMWNTLKRLFVEPDALSCETSLFTIENEKFCTNLGSHVSDVSLLNDASVSLSQLLDLHIICFDLIDFLDYTSNFVQNLMTEIPIYSHLYGIILILLGLNK